MGELMWGVRAGWVELKLKMSELNCEAAPHPKDKVAVSLLKPQLDNHMKVVFHPPNSNSPKDEVAISTVQPKPVHRSQPLFCCYLI